MVAESGPSGPIRAWFKPPSRPIRGHSGWQLARDGRVIVTKAAHASIWQETWSADGWAPRRERGRRSGLMSFPGQARPLDSSDPRVQTREMVIVITGPIASGKSTVARELQRELARVDTRSAVIDLDHLAEALAADGSRSDDSTWTRARREAATRANAFEDDGVAVVIADGSFNTPVDRAALEKDLHVTSAQLYVTLRVSFEEALRRAQTDPTRGRSRDRRFLGAYFAGRRDVLAAVSETDLVIDTEVTTATEAARTIARIIQSAATETTAT